jgi:hypothetical protein
MRSSPEILVPSHAEPLPFSKRRRAQKVVALALVSLVCCAAAGPTGCTTGPLQSSSGGFGPSGAAVTAAAIGVGAGVVGVVILVHHNSHTRKGCILSGPNGLEVQSDSTTLDITGVTANARVGDLYRLHGSMMKRAKHSTGNRTFVVEKVGKDFGPCPVKAPVTASSR